MRLIHHPTEWNAAGRKTCVAIGFFDGVHLGHQQVLRQTVADARQQRGLALAITFDRHPATLLSPEKAPKLIQTNRQKLDAMASLGLDGVWLIEFNRAFSGQTGEAFTRALASNLAPLHSVSVGDTFSFGHKRSGSVALLRQLGADLKFEVHGLAPVSLGGRIVSSTRIRESIQAGDLESASQMLGRSYQLQGPILQGDQLGRKLGFPTANLQTEGLALPPNGVYAAQATLQGRRWIAAVNIGDRPTLSQSTPQRRVEAHLLDFSGEVYGETLTLEFVRRIRDEQKFPDLAALTQAIEEDVKSARALLS